jgi:hypothetical protein
MINPENLYTQAEYARKVGSKRCWINQQVKAGNVPNCRVVKINGAKLIEIK